MSLNIKENFIHFERSTGKKAGYVKRMLQHILDHFIPHERNGYQPHALHEHALSLYAALFVVIKFSVIVFTLFAPSTQAYSLAITTENVFTLTNQSRSDEDLPKLKYNDVLAKAAQAKADDMLARQYFAHNTPTGETPWVFITKAGYNYIVAGENLAVDFVKAETMGDAWMNSPGHRANILNKNYEEIGIGISSGQYNDHVAIFVVQMFGTQMPQAYKAKTTPTKVVKKATVKTTQKSASVKGESVVQQGSTGVHVTETNFALEKDAVAVTVKFNTPVFKVLGNYNGGSVMFEPKEENTWIGNLPMDKLLTSKLLTLSVYDNEKQLLFEHVASFSEDVISNYHPMAVNEKQVTILGVSFNPQKFEHIFFGLFIAGLLSALILKIGIKRHVQHINTIANTAALIIFAVILW